MLIGDIALYIEHETAGLEKIDLGDEWTTMTNLPFVWAFWAGRPGGVEPVHLEALREARAAGVGALEAIAAEHGPDDEDQAEIARAYLQDNVQFELTADGLAGLKKFYGAALDLGIVQIPPNVRFYGS